MSGAGREVNYYTIHSEFPCASNPLCAPFASNPLYVPFASLDYSVSPPHRLAGKEAEHSAALSGAATAFRHESRQRVEEVMQRVRHEEKVHGHVGMWGIRQEVKTMGVVNGRG